MLHLPESAALVARLEVVERTGSTNADLAAAAVGSPTPAVLVTDHQTAGRGRLGRTWIADVGDSLAISVLLDPGVPRERYGWLSLAAGAAMTRALRGLGVDAAAKWPNDVLIGDRKVCGVLAEALPDGRIVVGAGLNHAAAPSDVPTATSLAAEGGSTDPDRLVAAYLRELLTLTGAFAAVGGDPGHGLREAVRSASGTLGRRVRVTLPDGAVLVGRAADVDEQGRIIVETGSISPAPAVPAGDVEHLRYE